MIIRRWRSKACWRAGLALLAFLAAFSIRVPLTNEMAGTFRSPPHAVAAHLADFNNVKSAYPHIESWWIEDQWSNYTSWRYVARFSCGVRCSGRAVVTSHDQYEGSAVAHGVKAHAHEVLLELTTCWTLPLLPWPAFCDEESVKSVVSGDGSGDARCAEQAAARAGLWAALTGRAEELRERRRRHFQLALSTFG